jgi:hypothetical protein
MAYEFSSVSGSENLRNRYQFTLRELTTAEKTVELLQTLIMWLDEDQAGHRGFARSHTDIEKRD